MTGPRWLVLGAALIAVAIVAVVLWPPAAGPVAAPDALPMPRRGEVIAAFAADGHPVWVIRHEDGAISVLDAFSTHVPFGINKPTWWCEGWRVIEDPFHGARYDEFGEAIAGPAPSGLRAYSFRIQAGHIFIGDAGPRPMSPSAGGGPSGGCTHVSEALVHDYSTLPEAESPTLAESSDDGWLRLHATLVPVPETRSGLLCPEPVAAGVCPEVGLPGIEHLLSTDQDRARMSVEQWTNADWLVHVVDGRIVEISHVLDSDD